MIGRQAKRQCFISLLLLLIGTSLAVAQPFTRRSSQVQHDGLKKTYEIDNFRLGWLFRGLVRETSKVVEIGSFFEKRS